MNDQTKFVRALNERGLFTLIAGVATKHGVELGELGGRGRTKAVARARHEAMQLVRLLYQWSYPEIGTLFGRDHTSVMYACNACDRDRRKFLAATRGAA